MNINAKKLVFAAFIFLLVIAVWQSVLGDTMHINIDGDEFDGPLGAVLSVLFGGAGMLLAGLIMTCVGIFLCVLFASLGVLAVAGVALAATIVLAVISPLLLPLLIPFALYWLLVSRPRKQRLQATLQQPV
ncbi:hypothetical protein GJ699_27950 [Duganella sp. FT80W]|uniref:Uncharacterized protein n=1 Tax=Duganella guangzhouensis TaxID=2666084 RepID=A0A6I2L832_9BURK|nr:hypothetical protein [Duganella guangzhouensis]MRW93832.1 hypothetical protein [Duganella guangzhouensis]